MNAPVLAATSVLALPQALALADDCVAHPFVSALAANDPLGIALPPYLEGRDAPIITPETLRGFAALYLHAELEQAGLLYAAELLADARFQLPLRDPDAARRLEVFARLKRDTPSRIDREALFGRLFGIGGAATASHANAFNNDFQRRLADLCLAVVTAIEPAGRIGGEAERQARLRDAVQSVAANLALRQYGAPAVAGTRLQSHLREAVALLSHPAFLTHFGAGNLWGVLERLFGQHTPDLGRMVTRGQAGLRLLMWVGEVTPVLTARVPTALPLPPYAIGTAAAQWLEASGLSTRSVWTP